MIKNITLLLLINLKLVYNFSFSNKNYNSPETINKLAKDNYRLVYYFSKNFVIRHKLNKEQREDLIQEGFIGLMYAARKYDKKNSANAKFTTYSGLWIKSYMTKYIKEMYSKPHIPLNEEITKYYDEDDVIINNVNLDILTPLEKNIVFKTYIRKPRIIKKDLATEYNITKCEVAKINRNALKKLKTQYMIENNITYL